MKKIKVIHLINSLDIGGAEIMLCKLLRQFSESNIENIVITLKKSKNDQLHKEIKDLNIEVHEFNFSKNPIKLVIEFISLRKLIRQLDPNIIQSWLYISNIFASLINIFSGNGYKLVWNIRSALNDFKNEKFTRKASIVLSKVVSQYPDIILINSKYGMEQHLKFGFKNNFKLIPNGFERDRFKKSESNLIKFTFQNNSLPVIALIGRFHPNKNHELFFKFAKNLNDYNFLLVGKGVNSPKCLQMIKDYNIESRVLCYENYSPIQDIYNSIDYLTLTSNTEGFPNVIGEAILSETFVFSRNIGDVDQMIKDEKLLFDNNLDSMLHSFKYLKNNPYNRLKVRNNMISNFSIEKVASQYKTLYYSLT